jgi:glycosyltransferase involved in cell wall biosynthesis
MQVAGAEILVAETIQRLGHRLDPVGVCLDAIGQLGEQLLASGVPVISFGRRPGLDLSVSRRMAREIRSRRVQVVHAHQYTPFFYSAIAARLSGIRPSVIFTEHGRHFPDVVSLKRRLLNRIVFDRLADRVNAVCEFSARSLSERDGFSRRRIEVIENGIEPGRYASGEPVAALRSRLGLDPSRRYIATVARFHPVKDHRTLLKAFAEMAHLDPRADLLLVGDGPLRAAMEQAAAEAGVRSRVRFMGVRRDVEDILRACDAFALTSISEAASITVLEAMACARPIVATAVGGTPELVRDGIDGLLVPRGDAPAIAAALHRVLTDEALAGRLGASALARVRTVFTLDRTISRYHALYTATPTASVA